MCLELTRIAHVSHVFISFILFFSLHLNIFFLHFFIFWAYVTVISMLFAFSTCPYVRRTNARIQNEQIWCRPRHYVSHLFFEPSRQSSDTTNMQFNDIIIIMKQKIHAMLVSMYHENLCWSKNNNNQNTYRGLILLLFCCCCMCGIFIQI